jgi:hypothetical protein
MTTVGNQSGILMLPAAAFLVVDVDAQATTILLSLSPNSTAC